LTARVFFALLLITTSVSAQNGTIFERASAQRDTLELLKELVALDTQNPPGNEVLVEDELRMHGDNERVPISSLGWGTEYLYRVLSTVAMR
jgi:hypothetical protein